ncbi:MAG: bifunctional phosphoribosylaminoimidazolecarboxamide formyltransferase/IMP cyclohydrolase [Rickettsiales bacterium]|nr:bifunctional phosphoribosylaminoimidazolecarboxamide formyltransferase/IMP cyclohydrolase [Rickettsiales bacterium]
MSKIRTALLSVSDKDGIVELATALVEQGVLLLSTGGTAKLLSHAGIAVRDVSEHTGFPEIMDGRVKTLHPRVHGGILARRKEETHQQAMQEHDIPPIDLVVINLYPFEKTVRSGAAPDECIENIDVGGPAMIRAAAKNHEDVTIVVSPEDYALVLSELDSNEGATTLALRRQLATKAFARTAEYDAAIASWFAKQESPGLPQRFFMVADRVQSLRYGENPHQQAGFYRIGDAAGTLAGARQLQGKELSYNNINDTDAAIQLVQEFTQPAVAIIKHANPCGVAVGDDLAEAYHRAFACDPKSAFGGIIALNRRVEAPVAQAIAEQFAEVIIAPEFSDEAQAIFAAKKNLRLLELPSVRPDFMPVIKSVSGGVLVQSPDDLVLVEANMKTVTKRAPTPQEHADLLLAFTIAKHVKSNAIVLVKDGRTHGIGAGQMSRVDSVHIACHKAEENGLGTQGVVLASDAFFPFDDNVHAAAAAGITALIQPGGSVRDEEVIAAADQYNMAMLFTGMRHFRH